MDTLLPLVGALFMLALAAYVVTLIGRELGTVRIAREMATSEQALLREHIAAIAEKTRREREHAERTWNGFRKFVISRKVLEAKDIRSFYLTPHDHRPLPSFNPGQYLTFRLNVPGQPKPVIRCYSLSDAPRPDAFRVTIKRIGPPPDKPDGAPGVSSSFFHDELDEGDIVDVKAPAGHFFLDPEDMSPVALIGGGIGLTPVLSMLDAIVEANARRDVWFFYGVRNRSEHAMADRLRQLAADNPNVQLHVCYSHPGPDDRLGHDYRHGERVSVDLLKRELPSHALDFFICGPPAMMHSLVEGLQAWGVPAGRIHHEAFGPASVKSVAAPETAPSGRTAEIVFARSGKTCAWDGRSSVLEAAEANGVRIDFGCRAGNCGTCLTALLGGEVDYASPPGTSIEAGSCLACIAVPKTALRLDA